MESQLRGTIQETLQSAINEHVFSGASVCVVDADGHTSAINAGTIRYDSQEPFTDTSLVDIASITKLLTSLAFHRFAQEQPEGLAFLQRPVREFLPDLNLDETHGSITIADLLEMRLNWKTGASLSGVTRDIFKQTSDHNERIDRLRDFLMQAHASKLHDEVCNYQDASYITLGWILEQLHPGMTYDQIVTQTVLIPLGMYNTTTTPVTSQTVPSGYQDGHYVQGIAHDPKARLVHGHAGFFSTCQDLATLAYMLQRKGTIPTSDEAYLNPETFQALTTPRTLDQRRGWWGRGIRRYQGPDQPPHGTNDLWFGSHAQTDTLSVSGFTAQCMTVFGENRSVVMLTNYHVPADLNGPTGDRGFPGEFQPVRMRIIEAVSR